MIRRLLIVCLLAAGCAGEDSSPADIALGSDACAHCRMTILSLATTAQIVGPGREPVLFDELACLRDYLAAAPAAHDAHVYVADHRTGAWIEGRTAVFTRTLEQTPMVSGLLAHADTASRDADPAAVRGALVSVAQILGPHTAGSGR